MGIKRNAVIIDDPLVDDITMPWLVNDDETARYFLSLGRGREATEEKGMATALTRDEIAYEVHRAYVEWYEGPTSRDPNQPESLEMLIVRRLDERLNPPTRS